MDNKEILKVAYRQITYISKNGCGRFKCRKCVMNKICDHFPSHSQQIATQMILMARSQNADNK